MIPLDDLVVGCDRRRLYLASLSLGRRVEPLVLHALDLRSHTPPLARFLAEIGRAQSAVVTGFDWGLAARMPFLPRVRVGRAVLAPASWRLEATDLPGQAVTPDRWSAGLHAWCAQRSVPEVVELVEGDRTLRLKLSRPAHLAILRPI